MAYQLKYKITNLNNNLSKIIEAELFSISDLCAVISFYKSIGFKVELITCKNNIEKKELIW